MWSQLIEAYSLREFTRIEDRLQALSGLAKKYSREIEDQYIAGHWLNSLYSDLLWIVRDGSDRRPNNGKASMLKIAPSWPWASVPPAVGIVYSHRYSRSTCKLIDYDIQRKSEDEFGAIHSARISLKARIRPLLNGEVMVE
jgi:hypothetical protein